MKTLGKLIMAGLLLGVAGVVALHLWPDVELPPEVAEWEKTAPNEIPAAHNSYYSLLGFGAEAGQDPHTAGLERAARIAEAMQAAERDGELTYAEPKNALQLPRELVDGLCKVEEEPCLAEYAEQAAPLRQSLAEQRVLIDRYLGLYHRPFFHDPMRPAFYTPVPNFGQVMHVHRLYLAGLGASYADGERAPALQALERDIAWLRGLLASSNTLIAKIIAASLLARDLHFFAQILDAAPPPEAAALAERLSPLSADEMGLENPLRWEFQSLAHTHRNFTRNGALSIAGAGWFSGLLEGLLPYKPNATIARGYAGYRQAVELSKLPHAEFTARFDSLRQPPAGGWDYLYNPLGMVLESIAMPDLRIHMLRVRDLDGLMRLVKLKQGIRAAQVDKAGVQDFLAACAGDLGNPYSGGPMQWDAERQVLYYEGPMENRKTYARQVGLGL